MTEEDIWKQVSIVFQEVFDDEDIVLNPETTAADIEEWDSLTNIQLLIAIERAFPGLKFSTGQVANLQNVGDLIAVIERHVLT